MLSCRSIVDSISLLSSSSSSLLLLLLLLLLLSCSLLPLLSLSLSSTSSNMTGSCVWLLRKLLFDSTRTALSPLGGDPRC
ncbi:hypothetical protein EDC96DRAFT_191738 [Choanephora cucurbitarum]|nr:hypothetical protein EDC96DRAFT_191738 [Choanephora cucurbitarum]